MPNEKEDMGSTKFDIKGAIQADISWPAYPLPSW